MPHRWCQSWTWARSLGRVTKFPDMHGSGRELDSCDKQRKCGVMGRVGSSQNCNHGLDRVGSFWQWVGSRKLDPRPTVVGGPVNFLVVMDHALWTTCQQLQFRSIFVSLQNVFSDTPCPTKYGQLCLVNTWPASCCNIDVHLHARRNIYLFIPVLDVCYIAGYADFVHKC